MDKAIYSDDQAVLCAALRDMRRAAGMTQQQVADALDVPQSFISKYESGERRLDILELRQICGACSSSLQTFVTSLETNLRHN